MTTETVDKRHPIYPRYSLEFWEKPTFKDLLQSYIDWFRGKPPFGTRGGLRFWADEIFRKKQNP